MIGAGPAGSAAAATLAGAGRSVLLVARTAGRTAGIGEGGPPGLDRVIADVFGPGAFEPADHLRSLGNRAAWGADGLVGTDFMFDPFGTGWHLDRRAFDGRLLDAAVEAGAKLADSADAAAGAFDLAPTVIDATGRHAVCARARGAHRVVADRQVAAVATYPRAPTDGDATTTVEAVEAGWWYTCPVPHGRRVVAFLTDGDLLDPALRTGSGFDRAARTTGHVATLLPLVAPSDPVLVAAGTAHLEPPVGDGWLAAGDAAASFDPLSSQGILTAVLMGREAARCIESPEVFTDRYAAIVADHEAQRRAIHRREARWPDAPFWRRRHG